MKASHASVGSARSAHSPMNSAKDTAEPSNKPPAGTKRMAAAAPVTSKPAAAAPPAKKPVAKPAQTKPASAPSTSTPKTVAPKAAAPKAPIAKPEPAKALPKPPAAPSKAAATAAVQKPSAAPKSPLVTAPNKVIKPLAVTKPQAATKPSSAAKSAEAKNIVEHTELTPSPKMPPTVTAPTVIPAAAAVPVVAPRPSHPPMSNGRPMPPPSRAASKDENFVEGDFVVYPTHGVGKVDKIATEEISGHRLELIHITFEENRMTLRVPVAKARSAGLRKLATRKMFDDAMNVLKGRARIKRTMWSRRAQEYEAKINSGDPIAIAEVVRDLHRNAGQPDQSFSERQIYEAAMDRLAAELAALDQTDKLAASVKLGNFLKTIA